jgi:MHS family proline/betaine transporter-like MFS transporter
MRPVGAVVLGVLGDRAGRKAALLVSFLLMAGATLAVGAAPTFAQIGLAAPLIVILGRLVQGFSAGGEIGGATALLVEGAPATQRGFFASWQTASQAGALLLGSLSAALVSTLLSSEALRAWGWRIPFLLSLLIVPLGLFIRLRLVEPQAVRRRLAAEAEFPLARLWREHRAGVVRGFGVSILWTVTSYFFLIYLPLFAATELKMNAGVSLFCNCLGLLSVLVAAPLAGALADRVGRYPVMLVSASLILVLAPPAFWLLTRFPSLPALLAFQLLFAVLAGTFTGPAPAAITELFPAEVRSSGMAIAYNLAVTLFGGFAPLIATSLVSATHDAAAPAIYVAAAAALSLIAIAASFRQPRL